VLWIFGILRVGLVTIVVVETTGVLGHRESSVLMAPIASVPTDR